MKNLNFKDIQIPKSWVKTDCAEPTPGSVSLKCWLDKNKDTVNCDGVKDCLGITTDGSGIKYLNEQGNWVTLNTTLLNGTYSELKTLKDNDGLVAGNYYLLTDYQTMYHQPDFDINGDPKPTMVWKEEAITPLLLLAISEDSFSINAYDINNIRDKIQYDFNIDLSFDYGGTVTAQPIKGRIIERIDEWNNRTDYDHRTVKFLRYDDGGGNFTVIKDNGNVKQEFLTFGNMYGNSSAIINGNYFGDVYKVRILVGIELGNNVINGQFIFKNKTNILFYNNTIKDYFHSNNIKSQFYSNIIGNNFYSNEIKDYFRSNLISDNFRYNVVGDEFIFNNIGFNCTSNIIGNYFRFNLIGAAFYANFIKYNFRSNSIGDSFYSNKIGDNFRFNTIGNLFNSNNILNDFRNNILVQNFVSNEVKNAIEFIDFTAATHVYNTYDCILFKNNSNVVRLSYIDGTDTVIYSLPNA